MLCMHPRQDKLDKQSRRFGSAKILELLHFSTIVHVP